MSIADTLKSAAAAAQAQQASAGAVTPVQEVLPAQGHRLTLEESTALVKAAADGFLKVGQDGFKIGAAPDLIEEIVATVNLAEVSPVYQITYGTPVQYARSYDGVKAVDGRNWATVCEQAKALDPRPQSSPFTTYEIVFTASEEVKSIKGKAVAPAGYRVGYTPSYTSVPEFAKILNDLQAKGVTLRDTSIKVKLTTESHSKGSNNWGTIKIELLEVL